MGGAYGYVCVMYAYVYVGGREEMWRVVAAVIPNEVVLRGREGASQVALMKKLKLSWARQCFSSRLAKVFLFLS